MVVTDGLRVSVGQFERLLNMTPNKDAVEAVRIVMICSYRAMRVLHYYLSDDTKLIDDGGDDVSFVRRCVFEQYFCPLQYIVPSHVIYRG